ncbi:hypothetical protein [Acrocarpospora catenulata]|uniref:hypothetical protein n=1 Tax=Acrocarpospora catenulata TaxID=2836182 RepID=UPI001BD9C3D6|nr:hypothetical protein [Acrocarpospora catenulata]
MVLQYEGSAVRLLQALATEPLRPRTVEEGRQSAAVLIPREVRERLGIGESDLLAAKQSRLERANGSAAVVVAAVELCAEPLGHRRQEQHEVLRVGTRRWYWGEPGGVHRVSHWREILTTVGGVPARYTREIFHPDVVPVTRTSAEYPAVRRRLTVTPRASRAEEPAV